MSRIRIDRCNPRLIQTMKPEALQRAIELFEIEWLAEIYVAAGFERRLFHAVNVVSRDRHDRRVSPSPSSLRKFLMVSKPSRTGMFRSITIRLGR